jgi:hypothetical protein
MVHLKGLTQSRVSLYEKLQNKLFDISEAMVVFSQGERWILANGATERHLLASWIIWYILPPAS